MNTRSVLVVDDVQRVAENVAALFRRSGWNAKAVFSGRECIESVSASCYDAVLLDMRVPTKDDGFETLREILRIRPGQCVLFLTGYGDIDAAVKALRMGAVNLVPKMPEIDTLIDIVEDGIRRKENEIKARQKDRAEAVLTLAQGLAHNIKNDLNAMALRLELIRKDTTAEERNRHLDETGEVLARTALRIKRLVRFGLLREVRCEPVNLRTAVEQAISIARQRHRYSAATERATIEVGVPENLAVTSTVSFLPDAIECLVDNAMDATRGIGNISVSSADKGGKVELMVKDEGPGFKKEFLSKPLMPYCSTHENTHTGFGLYFAKAVVEECGGQLIYSNSKEGRGAVVSLILRKAGN